MALISDLMMKALTTSLSSKEVIGNGLYIDREITTNEHAWGQSL